MDQPQSDDLARIGVIGLGRAGSIHLEALQSLPAVRVAAVCDPAVDARQRAAAGGIAAYAELDAMLDDCALDGVVVCTPPSDHADVSARCLARGLHVLCEKPLAPQTDDVLAMLAAAHRAQRTLLVASKFRHVSAVRRARSLLLAGEIGTPESFEISFCSAVDMRTRWNSQRHVSGGGVIIDNGCHAFDIVSYLFGGVRRVRAARVESALALGVEDSATLEVCADDGVVGRIDVSWTMTPARDTYLMVRGTRGTVAVGWHGAYVRRDEGEWQSAGGAYDKLGAHRAMHERFIASVHSVGQPWISAAECLQAVAAVEASYRSAGSGDSEWVALAAVRDSSPAAPGTFAHAGIH